MPKKKESFRKRKTQKVVKVPLNCPFCKSGTNPDYKEYSVLAKYITDRAKIVGKAKSGVCTKHQRLLSIAIKRCRLLGLLPFTPRV
jgi:small subunit ribosomal protein S18